MRLIFLIAMGLLWQAGFGQNKLNLIPEPQNVQVLSGGFTLAATTSIVAANADLQKTAQQLAEMLRPATGFKLPVVQGAASKYPKSIALSTNPSLQNTLGSEGYTLDVTANRVSIVGSSAAGVFYGAQTLMQLFPAEIESKTLVKPSKPWVATAVKISDAPRFAWRGMMLDVSRHFFKKEDVKLFIDQMVRYKYNTLHWHLTDDNGWRVEIKSYPNLTKEGACRVPRLGTWNQYEAPKPGEAATDCGFYTQDEIREIVQYAADRHVSILPEIDVPGHSMAANASYPELCVTKDESLTVSPGNRFSEWFGNGKFKMNVDNSLNPSSEKVYEFLDKVFGEIASLFPHPFIHMGGDECYHGYWEKDPGCQAFMKANSIPNVEALQSYFVRRVEKIISSKGKKMIGWDEILEGGELPKSASVMSWRGTKGGIEAAKMGHTVVMTPSSNCYLDLYQGDRETEPPTYGFVRMRGVYNYEPVPDGIEPKYILGGQGNVWTEHIGHMRQAQYMIWPRGWALAEVFWSPKEKKNWEKFIPKVEQHFARYDQAQLNYAKAMYEAVITTDTVGGKLMVTIGSEVPGTKIYYSMDNSVPDNYSTPYEAPFVVPKGPITLKVVTYLNGKASGRTIMIPRDRLVSRAGYKPPY